MSMYFEIEEDTVNSVVRIKNMHGVARKGSLPPNYIANGDRVFSVPNQFGRETVIVITGDGKNAEVIEKLYKGKEIPSSKWNMVYNVIMRAGDRLHIIRSAEARPSTIARKTLCV